MGKSKKDINVNSHKGTPIPLHASFENAYLQHILNINHKHQKSSTDKTPDAGSAVVTMNTTIEHKLFSLLKYLQLRYPFCDVAFTGYSYGAALSTLCAVRYASRHPTMRCTCHVFGSPKLGGDDFKRYAHKFGNLRIVRCETLGDEWVHCPDGGTLSDNVNGKGDVLWGHVGHGIILNPSGCGKVEYGTNSTPRSKKDVQPNIHNNLSSTLHEAVSFYKYDRHHPVKKEMLMLQQHTISAPVNHHDIKSYIFSIQQITAFKMPWFESFVGGGEIVGEVSSVNDPVPAQTNRATVSKTAIGDIDSDIVGTSVSYAGANIRSSPNHGGKKSARTLKQKQVRHILV